MEEEEDDEEETRVEEEENAQSCCIFTGIWNEGCSSCVGFTKGEGQRRSDESGISVINLCAGSAYRGNQSCHDTLLNLAFYWK